MHFVRPGAVGLGRTGCCRTGCGGLRGGGAGTLADAVGVVAEMGGPAAEAGVEQGALGRVRLRRPAVQNLRVGALEQAVAGAKAELGGEPGAGPSSCSIKRSSARPFTAVQSLLLDSA